MKEGEELLAEDRSSKGYLDLRVWQEIVLVISVRSSRPWPRVKSKGKEAALQKRHSGPRPSERNWLVQEQRVDLEHFLNSFKKWTIWEYFTTKYLDLVLLLVYFPEVKCRVVIRKIKENGDWGEKGQFKENIGLFGSWSSAVLRRCCFQSIRCVESCNPRTVIHSAHRLYWASQGCDWAWRAEQALLLKVPLLTLTGCEWQPAALDK